MSGPEPTPPQHEEASPTPPPEVAGTAAQLIGFAEEAATLVAAVGRLASAEASLTLAALTRMIGLRLIGFVLLALAVVLLAVAGTIVLAHWLGSAAAALAAIGVLFLLVAAISLWRAKIWGKRIGFAKTRAALAMNSPATTGPKS